MTTQSNSCGSEPGADDKERAEHNDPEPLSLEKRIAELHAQGILVGGEGPRDTLLQFLDQRHRERRERHQE